MGPLAGLGASMKVCREACQREMAGRLACHAQEQAAAAAAAGADPLPIQPGSSTAAARRTICAWLALNAPSQAHAHSHQFNQVGQLAVQPRPLQLLLEDAPAVVRGSRARGRGVSRDGLGGGIRACQQ